MKISILLADDHMILRDGIRALIDKEPDFELIGEADNGKTAVELACKLKPDVVIMDIEMQDINGIEATRKIISRNPKSRVLALSVYSEKQFVIEMLSAGAKGYLVKECSFEEMISAVRSIRSDRRYISPKILTNVLDDLLLNQSHNKESAKPLTPRETEVLCHIAHGKSTKETASVMNISIKTVDTHRQNIMRKLKIHNVIELTKYALRKGLITL